MWGSTLTKYFYWSVETHLSFFQIHYFLDDHNLVLGLPSPLPHLSKTTSSHVIHEFQIIELNLRQLWFCFIWLKFIKCVCLHWKIKCEHFSTWKACVADWFLTEEVSRFDVQQLVLPREREIQYIWLVFRRSWLWILAGPRIFLFFLWIEFLSTLGNTENLFEVKYHDKFYCYNF